MFDTVLRRSNAPKQACSIPFVGIATFCILDIRSSLDEIQTVKLSLFDTVCTRLDGIIVSVQTVRTSTLTRLKVAIQS